MSLNGFNFNRRKISNNTPIFTKKVIGSSEMVGNVNSDNVKTKITLVFILLILLGLLAITGKYIYEQAETTRLKQEFEIENKKIDEYLNSLSSSGVESEMLGVGTRGNCYYNKQYGFICQKYDTGTSAINWYSDDLGFISGSGITAETSNIGYDRVNLGL